MHTGLAGVLKHVLTTHLGSHLVSTAKREVYDWLSDTHLLSTKLFVGISSNLHIHKASQ